MGLCPCKGKIRRRDECIWNKEIVVMSVVNFAPELTLKDAVRLAKELYGINGSVEMLPSERDQNFTIIRDSGERFVLKIANAIEEYAMLEAQNQVMEHVGRHESLLSNVVVSLRGEKIETISTPNGGKHFVRLVTYLQGTAMGNVKRHSSELMFDLGKKLGRLDNALQGFDHPALHRDFYWDFTNGLAVIRKNAKLIRDKKFRNMVVVVAKKFEEFTIPLLPVLRKSVI